MANNQLPALQAVIVDAMQEKKAKDITTLDLSKLDRKIADAFIICHADNDRQVMAIADAIEENTRKTLREKPWHREGFQNKEWILLDYIDTVVHVFLTDKRRFYALEELWGDAEITRHQSDN